MPLVRSKLSSERNLAKQELYASSDVKAEPDKVLQRVSVARLVGFVRQLGDIAEFAADLFNTLHNEVTATTTRTHSLILRAQRLEANVPMIEEVYVCEENRPRVPHLPNSVWHADVPNDQCHITKSNLPMFMKVPYDRCRGPPPLFMLDKFDSEEAESCLKKYTDPSFFRRAFAESELKKQKKDKSEMALQILKRKGLNRNNGEELGYQSTKTTMILSSLPHQISEHKSPNTGRVSLSHLLKAKDKEPEEENTKALVVISTSRNEITPVEDPNYANCAESQRGTVTFAPTILDSTETFNLKALEYAPYTDETSTVPKSVNEDSGLCAPELAVVYNDETFSSPYESEKLLCIMGATAEFSDEELQVSSPIMDENIGRPSPDGREELGGSRAICLHNVENRIDLELSKEQSETPTLSFSSNNRHSFSGSCTSVTKDESDCDLCSEPSSCARGGVLAQGYLTESPVPNLKYGTLMSSNPVSPCSIASISEASISCDRTGSNSAITVSSRRNLFSDTNFECMHTDENGNFEPYQCTAALEPNKQCLVSGALVPCAVDQTAESSQNCDRTRSESQLQRDYNYPTCSRIVTTYISKSETEMFQDAERPFLARDVLLSDQVNSELSSSYGGISARCSGSSFQTPATTISVAPKIPENISQVPVGTTSMPRMINYNVISKCTQDKDPAARLSILEHKLDEILSESMLFSATDISDEAYSLEYSFKHDLALTSSASPDGNPALLKHDQSYECRNTQASLSSLIPCALSSCSPELTHASVSPSSASLPDLQNLELIGSVSSSSMYMDPQCNLQDLPPPPLPPLSWRIPKSSLRSPTSSKSCSSERSSRNVSKLEASETLPTHISKLEMLVKSPLFPGMQHDIVRHDKRKVIEVAEQERSFSNREEFLNEIRNGSFRLKPSQPKQEVPQPENKSNTSAIMEKMNAIRQAMTGSEDDEDDDWSDP